MDQHTETERSIEVRAVFAPLTWNRSVIIWISSFLTNILSSLSLMVWVEKCFQWRKKERPPWFPELWVIFLLVSQIIMLFYGKSWKSAMWAMWVIAVYGLIDVLAATLRDVVLAPQIHRDKKGGYIKVRGRTRWLHMAALNVIEVLTCFAILMLYFGSEFEPCILDPITAFYQSILTFTTLGYGDIRASGGTGQIIVIWELIFFLIFLAIKVPIAVSVIRVKSALESKEDREKET